MERSDAEHKWVEYRERELAEVTPLLVELGFELDSVQPHLGGERYLMEAVTTAAGKKLVLLGRDSDTGSRVVIKATSDAGGKREILGERAARKLLRRIKFAYQLFRSPVEIVYASPGEYAILIQQFIEQERSFLHRPLTEQFAIALKAFKAQEGAHATTYGHRRLIKKSFENITAEEYIARFKGFTENILAHEPSRTLIELLVRSEALLAAHREIIEQYAGFLTHTDFVPHNFRIVGTDIYLLDHSSIRFGNKYEGWARFLNFMALYNPELERSLTEYVRLNRTPEESLVLKLMRVYRLGEIIWYYTRSLEKTTGNLHALNKTRVHFWTNVLEAVLNDMPLPTTILETYRTVRDQLRSPEEKQRQQGLH